MAQTLNRTSNELVDVIRQTYSQFFLTGSTVYGWYDVFIEVDQLHPDVLTTFLQEQLHTQLNVIPIKTAVERTPNQPLDAPVVTS